MAFDMPMIPQMNPTGATGNGGITAPGAATGGAGNYNFGNTMNTGVMQKWDSGAAGSAPSGAATVTQNPAGGAGTSGTGGGQFVTQGQTGNFDPSSNEFLWQLDQTYGTGMGSVIEQFLQSGGGFNLPLTEQTVSAQEAAMQQNIQRGYGDLASHEAETGVGPNSSTAALAQGDYFSNAVAQENATIAQDFQSMWQSSMQNETGILGDIMNPLASNKASRDSSWMGDLSSILGIAGSAFGLAGGIGDLFSSFGGGADLSGGGGSFMDLSGGGSPFGSNGF